MNGGAAVAGPEEAGHQGGGADADEDGAAAEEPGEVVGGGLGGLGGDLFGLADVLEAAGQEAVEQVDGEDEQLLQQHRPRQHQDEQPGRPARVEQARSGARMGGGSSGSGAGPTPAAGRRSRDDRPFAASHDAEAVAGAQLTAGLRRRLAVDVASPLRTRYLAWPPVPATPTALRAWARVMWSPRRVRV